MKSHLLASAAEIECHLCSSPVYRRIIELFSVLTIPIYPFSDIILNLFRPGLVIIFLTVNNMIDILRFLSYVSHLYP